MYSTGFRLLGVLKTVKLVNVRSVQSSAASQWDLFSSVCLQRLPVIGSEMNWLERRMAELFNRVEVAESLYSDHEMRHFEDLRRSERIASGTNVEEKDLEEAAKQTAVDFEEASTEELKRFICASKATKADMTNNNQSVDRSLDKYLYLLTQQNIGGKDHWLFPQIEYLETDKSLRASAERLLQTYFPATSNGQPSIRVNFLGNSPAAFYSYRYPKEHAQANQKIGARIFVFKCNLDPNFSDKHPTLSGQFGERILKPEGIKQFSWMTRSEMIEKCPQPYWETLSATIMPDVLVDLEKVLANQGNKIARVSQRLKTYESKLVSSSVN